jgi:hypothetical protein
VLQDKGALFHPFTVLRQRAVFFAFRFRLFATTATLRRRRYIDGHTHINLYLRHHTEFAVDADAEQWLTEVMISPTADA